MAIRTYRTSLAIPHPLADYVKEIAERRGVTISAAIVMIIADHMDSQAAKAAGLKPKKGNLK